MSPIDDARRQELRKKAGDLLKMADKLFKSQDFEGAARLVELAMQTDTNNAYAIAYQERIKHAITQRDQKLTEASAAIAPPATQPASPSRSASPPTTTKPSVQEQPKRKPDEAQRRLEQEKGRPKGGASPAASAAPGTPGPTGDVLKKLDQDLQIQLEREIAKADVTLSEVHRGTKEAPPEVVREVSLLRKQLEEQAAAFKDEREKMRLDLERDFKRRLDEERKRAAAEGEKALAAIRSEMDQQFRERLQHETERLAAEARAREEASVTQKQNDLERKFNAERNRLQQQIKEERERLQKETERLTAEARAREEASVTQKQQDLEKKFGTEKDRLQQQIKEERERAATETAQRANADLARKLAEAESRFAAEKETFRKESDEQLKNVRKTVAELEARLEQERSLWLSEKQSLERESKERLDREIAAVKKESDDALKRIRQETEAGTLRRADQDLTSRLSEELAKLEVEVRRRFEEEYARKLQDERRRMDLEKQKLQDDLRRRLEEESANLSTVRKNVEDAMRGQLAQEVRRTEELRRREQGKNEQVRKQLEEDANRRLDEERKRLESEINGQRARLAGEREEIEQARRQVEESRERIQRELFVNRQEEQQHFESRLRAQLEEEFSRRLEEERQAFEERTRKEQYEAVEERRLSEERLRKEFEEQYRQNLAAELERLRADVRTAAEQRHVDALDENARKYEEAVRQAIEEGRRQAQIKKMMTHLEKAKACLATAQFEEALNEVTRVFRIEPNHAAAQDLERTIYAARDEHRRRQASMRHVVDDRQRQVDDVHRRLQDQERQENDRQQFFRQRDEIVTTHLQKADAFYREGRYDSALAEIDAALALDPTHVGAKDLEVALLSMKSGQKNLDGVQTWRNQQEETWNREETRRDRAVDQSREQLKREARLVYSNILRKGWQGGRPSKERRDIIEIARESLKISPADHVSIEREVQLEAYRSALEQALATSMLELGDTGPLEALRAQYGVKSADSAAIEALVASSRRGKS